MGKYRVGAFSAFSGKVGNLIGSHWRDISYLRARPEHVSNPNTPAQQTQRGKFALIMRFLKQVKPVLGLGFEGEGIGRLPFQNAVSYNLKHATSGTAPDVRIDYPAVLVTRGPLNPAEDAAMVSEQPGELAVSWTSQLMFGNASPDDEAVILLYNTSRDMALYITEGGPARSEESWPLSLPATYRGDTLEGYLSFVSPDREQVSYSRYLGSVTVMEEGPGT